MKNKVIKKFITLFIMAMIALLLVAMIDTKMKRRTFDFNVQNTYESISNNVELPPLDEMGLNRKSVQIVVDGMVQISADKNNINTKIFNPKYKFAFSGVIKFGTYAIDFDVDNPLVSTEIIFDGKWVTYASEIAMTTTTIHDNLYFLGVTVTHDNDYNIETISLDVYDATKERIGQFTFNVK